MLLCLFLGVLNKIQSDFFSLTSYAFIPLRERESKTVGQLQSLIKAHILSCESCKRVSCHQAIPDGGKNSMRRAVGHRYSAINSEADVRAAGPQKGRVYDLPISLHSWSATPFLGGVGNMFGYFWISQ